jgi:N-acetylmuramoyl-L-alanine amidase CwlA
MGTTWWAYTQVYEGRICSTGGNYNSIGIESCVNEGSDLWYTWQLTAQLVARLMDENSLDITRVRGHHFYTAKNCPQPMLENDQEIWYEFLELVEAEHELLTKYADYEISFVSHNPEILDNNGRIVKQPSETTSVSYTITFTKDGQSQSITLASMVQGLYVGR